ncbi:hypothetical protein [Streptomyces lavendulocolor]|uniref:hypothetical protein n=1 Tax=Streptomyces lavendulocolor TaxID=67316 RepID=UPI0033DD20B1
MRFALRTAIATAVMAGAVLTPTTAATATAAEGAGGSRPATGSQTAGTRPAAADAQPAGPGTAAGPAAPDTDPAAPAVKPAAPDTDPAAPAVKPAAPDTEPAAGEPQPGSGEREPLATVQLVEGMSAQVFRVDGTLEADVRRAGRTLFTLKAGEKRTYNRVEVLLRADGRVIPRQVDEDMGELVRTRTLKNGTYVKIYRVTPDHHRADTFVDGTSIGVLDADGRSVAAQNDVQYLVLDADGSAYDWLGRDNVVTGAEPGVYRLPNGRLIRIVRTESGRYGISACTEDGCPKGVLLVDGTGRAVLRTGSAVVVLDRDGTFSHYVVGAATQGAAVHIGAEVPGADKGGDSDNGTGKGAGQDGDKGGDTATPATAAVAAQGTTSQTSVVPRGGVAAGAETAGEGDSTLLVAAGAGAAALSAAALSAAGLGFVAMRRRAADHR